MQKIETVLSLFDGHSGCQIALKELGITPTYYASEIDKHAIKATMQNFPNTIQLGSVVDINVSKLPKIDLLSGGSPCTNFSFAGKRKGMSTTCEIEILDLETYLQLKSEGYEFEGQSYLFWEYMRILTDLRKINPDIIFLLENVEMGKKWEGVLSKAIGINGLHINSALVSAQNRERIYWNNIYTEKQGLFGYEYCAIPQPQDRKIFLKDILESEVDEKYYLSETAINRILRKTGYHPQLDPDKTGILNTKNNSGQLSIDNGTTLVTVIKKDGSIKPDQNKAACFTAGGHSGGNHSDMDLIAHNMMPRSSKTGKGGTGHLTRTDGKTYCLDTGNTNAVEIVAMRGRGEDNQQQLEQRKDGKTNTLTSVQKDNLVLQINDGLGCDYRTDEGIRIRENGKSGTLQARARNDESCGQLTIQYPRIRRLTPLECSRLQTIPSWYSFAGISETQIYKMLGNGWTVEVIKHLLSFISK